MMNDGFGSINWWGFSPSLDLQGKDLCLSLDKLQVHSDENEELHILLVGAGDCRHILQTLAQCYKHPSRQIHFYVLETQLELYARCLFLMAIALEHPRRMGLQEKTELFLELYGNTLVRQQTMDYVHNMSKDFIRMVTDFDYLEKKLPLMDLSLLKFKERDMLEGIFKFWRIPDNKGFDINQCWDLRLRRHLGARYDAIPNVFDWDYNMKLVDKGAGIVNSRMYSQWRTNGVAFAIREGTYETVNKTLASGLVFKHEGERLARRGYWGDILVSPYITFGILCEKQEFFKKANNYYTHSSVDVSEYNVLSLLYELSHQQPYVAPEQPDPPADPPKQTATLTEITEEEEEEEGSSTIPPCPPEDPPADAASPPDTEYEALPVPGAKIHFLPLGCLPDLHKKTRFQQRFNMVYLSNSLVHLLTPQLNEIFANNAAVILETAKFMLELQPEQCRQFAEKVTGLAGAAGCKSSPDNNLDTDTHLEFSFSRKS